MLDSLGADAIRRWCAAALAAFRLHQREIDELNVYPVPDSDTGTNLVLTLEAAHRALLAEPHLVEPGQVLQCMARGALLGARGNSGVILSQFLRGIADVLGAQGEQTQPAGRVLAKALRNAVDAGYAAVATPVEGTILTVARAAADAAESCEAEDLSTVVATVVAAADAALVRTPEQLAVLARAGVVDAGGQGLCVFLHALAEVVTGVATTGSPLILADHGVTVTPGFSPVALGFEVQYLLDAPEDGIGALRDKLAPLGDSLVIVGTGDGSWNVHVHVNDVGAAIEAGVETGRPYRIRVTPLPDKSDIGDIPPRSVVAFVAGEGLIELLRSEGALTNLDGVTGQVILLAPPAVAPPENWTGGELRVIPLRSPVQALAALAVHDPVRPFDDDVIAMAEAAGACRYAEVTVATREALTVAGPCRPGDILVLVNGEVNVVAGDVTTAATTVLDRMLSAGGELVTLLLGVDTPPELRPQLEAHLAQHWPFVEARTYSGGQEQPLLIGVE